MSESGNIDYFAIHRLHESVIDAQPLVSTVIGTAVDSHYRILPPPDTWESRKSPEIQKTA